MSKRSLLFLCTGNSCRSQMAEGFARHLSNQQSKFDLRVESAGIEAHGKNPKAILVMNELGIDISSQESTKLTDTMLNQADILVTVCGHAKDHCPVIPKDKQHIHWPLTDPAKAEGDETQVLTVFREVRDDINVRTKQLLEQIIG